MNHPNVRVFGNPQELAWTAAETFAKEATRSIREKGRFAVALAGGSTPKRTYELLVAQYLDALDWSKVYVFFGDERTVPPDHEDSNYSMAHEALLSCVPVGGVYRMRGELPPPEAAILYEEELMAFFGGPPGFDLVLLGIGEDGHTASLFPNTPALRVCDRWAVENPVPQLKTVRITLTSPAINVAETVVFLVSGAAKGPAVGKILGTDVDSYEYPAKLIQPKGELLWMLDRAAAGWLTGFDTENLR